MSNRRMKISFSVPITSIPSEVVGLQENNPHLSQTVYFLNGIGAYSVSSGIPQKISYEDRSESSVILLNYQSYQSNNNSFGIENYQGWAPVSSASSSGEDGLAVTIFRQEVDYDSDGNLVDLTIYQPVDTFVTNFHLRDLNVRNNRLYKYVLYPTNRNLPLRPIEKVVQTKWSGWSITELHPVDDSMKVFTASSEDVWVFNSNVETGEQRQNVTISEQQTLGMYPRYTRGRQNYISSTVSCLLGDVLPAEYILRKRRDNGKVLESLVLKGGYTEELPFSRKISSNDRVDMLAAWRKLVYSNNPKLLKDRKGQSFLVVLTESSNNPMDNVAIQPDTISFSWTEIGTTEGVQIINTSLGGGVIIDD